MTGGGTIALQMQVTTFTRGLPSGYLDRFGAAVSAACGVHCFVTPWLLALLPASSFGFLADERTEWALLTAALLSGLASLVPSYIRHHHDGTAMWWFATGSLVSIAAKTSFDGATMNAVLVALGGLALFGGHRVNARLCRDCETCQDSTGHC